MWARAAAAVGVGVTVGTGLVWIPEWVGVRQVGLESRDGSDLKSAPTTPRLKPCHDRTGPLLSAIGNTPLLEIPSLSAATGCRILGKAEWMNPGGSIKDRPALYLVEAAERSGQLTPGGTIVEATGGNTGIGLAMIAAAKGYKSVFTHPASISSEKVATMQMLGAETVACEGVPITDPRHYYHVAVRIAAERKNSVAVQQFENTASAQSHYETTAPEILSQTGGKVDVFVCSAGTGGTIGGVARYLKEKRPNCQVWLADPEGSALAPAVRARLGGEAVGSTTTVVAGSTVRLLQKPPGGSIAEGVGTDRKTANFALALDKDLIDGEIVVSNAEIVTMAYHLLRTDGIWVGPSAAMNVVAAHKLAKKFGPGKTIVTVLCDSGARYNSKMYNAEWLQKEGLSPGKVEL